MTTKNLVPRADGEGKIGIKGSSNLTWKEINAVSGSFDELVNTEGSDLIAAGNNITITKTTTAGSQYTISSQSSPITGTLEDLNQLSEVDAADKFIVSTAQGAFGYEDPSTVRSTLGLSTSDTVTFGNIVTDTLLINNVPTADQHAATKSYVDSVASGLDIYDSVRAATTTSFTMSSTASSTTLTLVNGEGGFDSSTNSYEVDGINLDDGDRVLIKDGVDSNSSGVSNRWNGIYTVGDKSGSTLTLTRSSDMDVPAEFNSGAFFFVEEGNNNADAGFVLSTDSIVTVGTSDVEFVKFSSAGQISAGDALTKTGNTLNVDINGQTVETSVQDADEILIYDSSASAIKKMTRANFVAGLGAGSLSNIVEDTTPQLGGNLDVNGNLISSVSNGNIEVAPDGSGSFKIRGNTTSGSGRIVLNCENNSHGITLKGPPHSAGANYTLTLPNTDGNADQILKTNGSGALSWVDQSSGGASTLSALTDVTTSSPENYDALYYDESSSKWLSGNLNSRSITSTGRNTYAFGNSIYSTHERVITVADFDNSRIFWPSGITASSIGTYTFTLPDVTATGSSRLKAGQKIKIASTFIDQNNHTIIIRPHDWNASTKDTYIYSAGAGSTAHPGATSVTLNKSSGFIEIEVYDNDYTHPNFFYNRGYIPPVTPNEIGDLSDVNVALPTDNAVLTYSNTSAEWVDSQSLNLTGTITCSQFRLGGSTKRLVHAVFDSDFYANYGVGLSGQESTILQSDHLISVMPDLGALSVIPQDNSGSNVYNSSLRLYDGGDGSSNPVGQNKNYISLSTPGKLSATTEYKLPTDAGTAGQILTTDGGNSGSPVDEVNLYWSTVSGGSSSSSLPSLTSTSAATGTLAAPTSGEIEKIYVFDSTNALAWTVPNIANNSISAGFKYNIKNIGSGQVTINAEQRGSLGGTDDLIDGQTSITMSQYDSYTIVSGGSSGKDWYII